MRQELGYYNNLAITAKYSLDAPEGSKVTPETFFPALKLCIARHPILSCTVSGPETEAPVWIRPETVDLRNNIKIIQPESLKSDPKDELLQLQEALAEELNEHYPFLPTVLPWKIVVLPVAQQKGEFYIIFSTSHAHADGQSGLAFHETFLRGLNASTTPDLDPLVTTPSDPLLPPLDATPMPISWSFLLGPLLGTYLPSFITTPLGIPREINPSSPDMWRATPYTYTPSAFHTGLSLTVIPSSTLTAALRACRAHDTKLTGLLHQLVVRALSAAIPDAPSTGHPAGSFGAQSAISLRRMIPSISNHEMAVLTNAAFEIFPRVPPSEAKSPNSGESVVTDAMWAAASNTSRKLAATASTLADQPVGLLKYLAHFRMWLTKHLGKERDCSYEITNVMAFDPEEGAAEGGRWTLGRTLMAQPASVTGAPVSFAVASRKGGEMVVAASWQKGVLGLEEDEEEVVKGIGERVRGDLERLAEEQDGG
ncbi:hypothetical protein BU16DRAFT_296154 [Lophium mytilinum]|uniref:Alcohol acetyltransferase n=1 Tax=Lophium mytilinum TaxID=390894 RepID=A0A6A6R3K8_9PEZI|nr:hypothetical protein BU16DRAFT_296154 [Lophium mytilinum]